MNIKAEFEIPDEAISKGIEQALLKHSDIVLVTRCKDCKFAYDAGMSGLFCDHPDNRNPLGCIPNDYCNNAERVERE